MEYHVAPMKNITDWTFRSKCNGATDSYTEMIQLRDVLAKKDRAMEQLDLRPIPKQRQWIQILTNSYHEMKKLPQFLLQYSNKHPERSHIFGVNVNVGCPDPNIIAAGQGAALIKRRKRLLDMAKAFFNADNHKYHLSYKFRLGMNERDVKNNMLTDVLKILYSEKIPFLNPPIIHFKHAKQSSDEFPIWEALPSILELEIPIILNGNLHTPIDLYNISNRFDPLHQRLFHRNVKGIMIGRALLQNPRLFQRFIGETK